MGRKKDREALYSTVVFADPLSGIHSLFFEDQRLFSLFPSLLVIPPSVLVLCSMPTFWTLCNANECNIQHYLLSLFCSQTQRSEERKDGDENEMAVNIAINDLG